ncbi:GH18 domain-containing protein [Plasmodiophora brassicae]
MIAARSSNEFGTGVNGSSTSLVSLVQSLGVSTVTWAFAGGTCGSETWVGVPSSTIVKANVPRWVDAGLGYIVSTGGAQGTFRCARDADFLAFVARYNSRSLVGFDFDIEGGQTQADVDSLVQRVKVAQAVFPGLRWSFTVATLGGTAQPSLGHHGTMVMSSIARYALTGYYINLMAMDYGSSTGGNCIVSNTTGQCQMGRSAVRSAVNLHKAYNLPYAQIEVTPMIGGNDTPDETFTIDDVRTLARFALRNGLGGLHMWSLDRDTDCPSGPASPTCNTYGQAGTLGFTKTLIAALSRPGNMPFIDDDE